MTHRPERFEVYTELPDGSGFKIKGTDYVFKFDSRGGWYDEQGNYYNRDGQPSSEPSLSSSHSVSGGGGDYDDFDKQYRLVQGDDDPQHRRHSDDEESFSDEQIRTLQKIDRNKSILSQYTTNRPLRVFYRSIEFALSGEKIMELYQGLVETVVPDVNGQGRRTGNGYFVVANREKAKKIVDLEGRSMVKRSVTYRVEPLEELLSDPIPEKYLKGAKGVEETKQKKPVEVPKPQSKPVENQKSTAKEVEKKVEKVEETKKQKSPWVTYKFNLPVFHDPKDFKAWMESNNLIFDKDYRSMKRVTNADKSVFGTVQIFGDSVQKVNGKQIRQNTVQFTLHQ